MNIKTIEVVDFNDIGHHIEWVYYNRLNKLDTRIYPGKLVYISFQYSKNLEPYHITPLACLVHEYLSAGFNIKYINISEKIKDYLQSFHFFELACNPSFNDFPNPSDSRTLPLWLIDQNAISLYPGKVQAYYEENLFSGNDLFSLSISLSELLNNVFDHSGSLIPGYTFTQHSTKLNQIITSVCDFGIGIPKKIKEFKKLTGKNSIDNKSALKEALETLFSTKSTPHNKGRGWDNIISVVRALHGKLIVISSNVNYVLFPDGEVKMEQFKYYFHGTSVIIYIDTQQLSLKEPEESDEVDIF